MNSNIFFAKKDLCQLADIKAGTLWKKARKIEDNKDTNSQYLPIEIAREILAEYFKQRYNSKKKIQTFFNFKGGTGKTSMTFNLSYFFYLLGYKVLVIDCDPQCHLTRTVTGYPGHDQLSIYELLEKTTSFARVVKEIHPEYHFIPSSIKLSFIDSLLASVPNREKQLLKVLEPVVRDYDFVFIDVNPSINVLNRNAIIASDVINIICEAQPYSFYGMETLLQEFTQLAELTKDNAIDFNVILNKMEQKVKTSMEIVNALQKHEEIKTKLFDEVVRKSEDFNVAAKENIPVLFLKGRKNSSAKQDIMNLGKELLIKSCVEDKEKHEVKDAA